MPDATSLTGSSTMSHGRGGAGNIGASRNMQTDAGDLSTPIIKSPTYTTGRGGTGNMAHNDPNHPEIARASQDVEVPPPRQLSSGSPAGYHVGRGGQGNIALRKQQQQQQQQQQQKKEQQQGSAMAHEHDLSSTGKSLVGDMAAKLKEAQEVFTGKK